MIASMFNLDHRLAELRTTEQEQKTARELREAGTPAARPFRRTGEQGHSWTADTVLGTRLSRPAAR